MTPNAAAQLAILADALTEIVDLASGGPKLVAPSVELLARAGDIAAEALSGSSQNLFQNVRRFYQRKTAMPC